jgi:hypothetical protein
MGMMDGEVVVVYLGTQYPNFVGALPVRWCGSLRQEWRE